MPTNKIALRTADQFMADYVPVYSPLYPLFMGKSLAHEIEVGKQEFRRVDAVGDIRQKRITPKDTEIKQIAVMEAKKTFKKYFLANQFIQSTFQSREGIEEVQKQVLDEHQIQMDELFLLGEGSSASTMLNNGLFWSNDPNYSLQGSTAIAASDARLPDLHAKIVASAEIARAVAGQKVVILYGTDILPLFNSLYVGAGRAFRAVIQEALPDHSFIQMPAACTPSGASGWIVANLDQCKLHYTALPQLKSNGVNEEKEYVWSNFLMGSVMLEVMAKYGVVRQPATLA